MGYEIWVMRYELGAIGYRYATYHISYPITHNP